MHNYIGKNRFVNEIETKILYTKHVKKCIIEESDKLTL